MPSLFICLERDLPGFESGAGEGRALSTYEPQLTALAKQLSIKPLMEFFSVNPDEVAGLLDDSEDLPPMADEQWFSAADGLATIDSLLAHLSEKKPNISEPEIVAKELQEFRRVLLEAKAANVGWHLAVDY